MPKLTEQELRAEFMAQMIGMRSMSVQSAMLATEAVVTYVLTGAILGITPADVSPMKVSDRGRASARAR